jgi:hypothetical protein
MEGNQNLLRLAELMTTQRTFYGWTVETMAARADVGLRTMHAWLAGQNTPGVSKRDQLEKALGWVPGAVTRVLNEEYPDRVGLDDVQAPPAAPAPTRAADLTDDELFLEVTHRLREWRNRAAVQVQAGEQAGWGLAADSNPEFKGEEGAPDEG